MSLRRAVPREVLEYVTRDGRNLVREWMLGLRDVRGVGVIRQRINRLRLGNLGHWASVGDGVYELKVNHGPGYRVYFAEDGDTVVLLLCGGDKKTQRADIARAKQYWQGYRSDRHAETNPSI